MTDNQNMNKTSMKDVQQQRFYQTASLRVTKCFRKPWFLCTVFVCSFVLAGFLRLKEVYERVSKQDFRQLSIFFYRQPLQLGIL